MDVNSFKSLQNKKIIKDLGYFLKLVFLFCLSSYICLLIFPLIKLKFSNPNNFIGVLSFEKYNPLNNSLRYVFYIIAMPTLFFIFKKLLDTKKYLYLRYIFIGTLVFSFFIMLSTLYLVRYSNIDMFHDSEQLGVGSAVYFFNKIPYKDMFFLHGAFSDPLIASISFKLFGPAIGSYYLFNSLLVIFSFFVFYLLLSKLIDSEFLFYIAGLFFFSALYTPAISRDLTTFIYVLILISLVKNKINEKLGLTFLSFIAFATFYYTADRGYYLFTANIFFVIIDAVFKFYLCNKKQSFSILLKNIFNKLIWVASGTVIAVMLGVLVFGIQGTNIFFKDNFIYMPMMKSFLDEYKYPLFSATTLHPNWLLIIMISAGIAFIFYSLIYRKKQINNPVFII